MVTVAEPVKPLDGRLAAPLPTLVVPFASVNRSVPPAQAAAIDVTVTVVTLPVVSRAGRKVNPSESHRFTAPVPPPRRALVTDIDAATALTNRTSAATAPMPSVAAVRMV
jgi:hypothetical protein